ncbi:TetR family transcriptional regulator [Winogradskyella sp. 3972H.M.0a.05]|uniref:TetR/AcrR family transcriptional regulator n=1 Tax=Winogradskyella sp. 3972H.M.0a.05 TaxID=2950277 RepID=UPI003395EB7F
MPKVEVFDRALVLNQVTEVFHLKGYNATSMQDIVDSTGLNRSSIYNSFGNKMNLFLECLKTYRDDHNRSMSKLFLKAENPLDAINILFEFYINEISKDTDNKGCLICNCISEMANQDEAIVSFLMQNQVQMLNILEDLINEGQTQGVINKKQQPRDYAYYLLSSLQGMRTTGVLLEKDAQLKTIKTAIIQTIC